MAQMTAEQEAEFALWRGLERQDLSVGAQLAYDRLKAERMAAGLPVPDPVPRPPQRSSPETRAAISGIFKTGASKYARPFQGDSRFQGDSHFQGDSVAGLSFLGRDWQEYGQVVLQVAILDTLLSIEAKLTELGAVQDGYPG